MKHKQVLPVHVHRDTNTKQALQYITYSKKSQDHFFLQELTVNASPTVKIQIRGRAGEGGGGGLLIGGTFSFENSDSFCYRVFLIFFLFSSVGRQEQGLILELYGGFRENPIGLDVIKVTPFVEDVPRQELKSFLQLEKSVFGTGYQS